MYTDPDQPEVSHFSTIICLPSFKLNVQNILYALMYKKQLPFLWLMI